MQCRLHGCDSRRHHDGHIRLLRTRLRPRDRDLRGGRRLAVDLRLEPTPACRAHRAPSRVALARKLDPATTRHRERNESGRPCPCPGAASAQKTYNLLGAPFPACGARFRSCPPTIQASVANHSAARSSGSFADGRLLRAQNRPSPGYERSCLPCREPSQTRSRPSRCLRIWALADYLDSLSGEQQKEELRRRKELCAGLLDWIRRRESASQQGWDVERE